MSHDEVPSNTTSSSGQASVDALAQVLARKLLSVFGLMLLLIGTPRAGTESGNLSVVPPL